MLFYLTGDIQTGKTRWLQALTSDLEAQGVPVAGVLAPGVWRENPDSPNGLEKLGIDNLLLPQHELISFGRRADLAREEGLLDEESQSAKAGLGWIFPDAALDAVNRHLASIGYVADQAEQRPECNPGFLVIDELGPLELIRGGGLVEAVRLVQRGATAEYPHALIIVRESLLTRAHELFDASWSMAAEELFPDGHAKDLIESLYGIALPARS